VSTVEELRSRGVDESLIASSLTAISARGEAIASIAAIWVRVNYPHFPPRVLFAACMDGYWHFP
jgi:hypothetical protein